MTPDQMRARRQSLGLTQAELAGVLGVHRDTVNGWEQGRIALTEQRSFWLDAKMVEIKRKPGRPKKRRATASAGEVANDAG